MAVGNGKLMRGSALEFAFGKTPVTPTPTTIFVSLHTANPGDDGSGGAEVSVTTSGYARQAITPANWAAAVVGANDVACSISNALAVTFGPSAGAGAAWGTITYLGAWRTSTGSVASDFIGRVQVLPNQIVSAAGQSVPFAIGAITFTDNSGP